MTKLREECFHADVYCFSVAHRTCDFPCPRCRPTALVAGMTSAYGPSLPRVESGVIYTAVITNAKLHTHNQYTACMYKHSMHSPGETRHNDPYLTKGQRSLITHISHMDGTNVERIVVLSLLLVLSKEFFSLCKHNISCQVYFSSLAQK